LEGLGPLALALETLAVSDDSFDLPNQYDVKKLLKSADEGKARKEDFACKTASLFSDLCCVPV